MIGKQQKFIEDNDIGSAAQGDNIKIFLGDDEEEDDNDDDQIEELATEANQDDGHMINPRSNSVTGKYNDGQQTRQQHGNLLGAGALSSAASQNIQPSMEGFGGIVGVSAAAAGGQKVNKQQANAVQGKKKDENS